MLRFAVRWLAAGLCRAVAPRWQRSAPERSDLPEPPAAARLDATAERHLRDTTERRAVVSRLRAAAGVARDADSDEKRLQAFRKDLRQALRRD